MNAMLRAGSRRSPMPSNKKKVSRPASKRRSVSSPFAEREEEILAELNAMKREEVIHHAAVLFNARGYHETTLEAIATSMGAGKPYIYNFFASKQELLAEVASRGTEQVYAAVVREMEKGGDPEDRLRRVALAFTRYALLNHMHVQIYFRENLHLPEAVRNELSRKRRAIDKMIRMVIDDGIAQGQFARRDSYVASLTIAGMMSYTFAWYNPNGRLTIDYICEEVGRNVIAMLRQP